MNSHQYRKIPKCRQKKIFFQILSKDKGILNTDDFSTDDDIEKQLLFQQIAEEKKRM